MTADVWRSVVESDPDEPVAVTVDRYDNAGRRVIAGAPVRVRIARNGIFGAVYYWAIGAGRLERINAGTGARENFMPSPPTGCVACHAISRDGRYLAGALDGSPRRLALFDLTRDLTVATAPTLAPPTLPYVFATFNPDGTRLLATGFGADNGEGSDGFVLVDARTGGLTPADGLPTARRVTHPDWSPDGRSVAYVGNTGGAAGPAPYPTHFTTSDVLVMSVTDGARPGFGTPRVLHHGADLATATPGGAADAHPSWSPDSRVLVFQHGPVAYSQFNPYGALYVVAATGGAPARLDRANGGSAGTSAFWPAFSPFLTREPEGSGTALYYWLAFFSQRDYGNAQAGTRGTNRRQLWVTTVRADGSAGSDPSSVPYWLPNQDTRTDNAAARWAPVACRSTASECTVSSECCSGRCVADASRPGRYTCQPPPPAECRRAGQLCGGDGDCCAGLTCFANVCGVPPG